MELVAYAVLSVVGAIGSLVFVKIVWSLVTREQLRWQVSEGDGDARLEGLPESTRLPWLHPDQHLDDALRRVGDWPVLPVVSRADFQKLEGIISLSDILSTFGVISGKASVSVGHSKDTSRDKDRAAR